MDRNLCSRSRPRAFALVMGVLALIGVISPTLADLVVAAATFEG